MNNDYNKDIMNKIANIDIHPSDKSNSNMGLQKQTNGMQITS